MDGELYLCGMNKDDIPQLIQDFSAAYKQNGKTIVCPFTNDVVSVSRNEAEDVLKFWQVYLDDKHAIFNKTDFANLTLKQWLATAKKVFHQVHP